MILIVADTGPINYLIQIGEIEILPRIVEKVILPSSRANRAVARWRSGCRAHMGCESSLLGRSPFRHANN